MIRFAQQAGVPGLFVFGVTLVVLGLSPLGCGDAEEVVSALPLVTIAECEELGGAPLFDPEDERPIELSCPDGLEAIAEFDEAFSPAYQEIIGLEQDGSGAVLPDILQRQLQAAIGAQLESVQAATVPHAYRSGSRR